MQIHRLTAFHVPIALRKPVRHASFTRADNDTLLLRCVLRDGSVGWGEGLPRTYVTGESIDTAWHQLAHTSLSALADARFSTPFDAAYAVSRLPLHSADDNAQTVHRECFGNSVRCALEMALLDATGRSCGRSLADLIREQPEFTDISQFTSSVRYSGVITSQSPAAQTLSALKMRLFGFEQVKVKVGTAELSDAGCLARARTILGRHCGLRLDANEAWHCDNLRQQVEPLLPFQPLSLEQPVPHTEVSGLGELRRQFLQPAGLPVMLDESLCSAADAQRAIAGQWCDAFNIRLSKCGGILPSLQLVQLARKHGIRCQLGCQVGETGILSAAGRHFACSVSDLWFLEGSFDRFLVRDRLTEQDLTFGRAGRAFSLLEPGLSVAVDECRVRQLAKRSLELLPR
ncbi:MAG: enolase C-terminal domain-like protein [Planctomycetaceae bacterium]